MMTSSNGNIFRVTGHLCREFTGHRWIPSTKASDMELWCFLWYSWINCWASNSEAFDLRCPLWRHCNSIVWYIMILHITKQWLITIHIIEFLTKIECLYFTITGELWRVMIISILEDSYGVTDIILCMGSANEKWCYFVLSSLIGWAQTQNDTGILLCMGSANEKWCYIVLLSVIGWLIHRMIPVWPDWIASGWQLPDWSIARESAAILLVTWHWKVIVISMSEFPRSCLMT